MPRKHPVHFRRVEPIDPTWRAAVFGDYDAFDDEQCLLGQRQFAAMKHAFRHHGGFVNTDDLALRLRCRCEHPASRLEWWIVSRAIVCISWEAQNLMPAFQFSHPDMSLRPCCSAILHELRDVLDNWEIALWFAAPHARLDYAAPVAILANEASAVLSAARTDRLLAGFGCPPPV